MFKKILTTGQKIKGLREKLEITQDELAGEKITREFLSLLEHDKRKLKLDIAEFLARKINKTAIDKGIYLDFLVSAKTLMEDEKTQAINIINSQIKDLENNFNEIEMIKLIDMARKYKLVEDTISLYTLATEHFFKNYNTEKSIKYAQQGLLYSTESHNIMYCIQFNIKLVKNYLDTENYTEALNRNNNIVQYLKTNNVKACNILNNVNFNFAKIYKSTGDYNLALEYANKITTINLNKSKLIDLKILIANCYIELNKFTEAIELYSNILKYKLDKETKAMSYRNLSECYFKMKVYNKAFKYINLCLDIRINTNSVYLSNTFVFLSEMYIETYNIELAKENLLKAININKNRIALSKLIDIYINENEIENIINIINLYSNILEYKILIKLSKIFLKIDTDITEKLLNIALKKIDDKR